MTNQRFLFSFCLALGGLLSFSSASGLRPYLSAQLPKGVSAEQQIEAASMFKWAQYGLAGPTALEAKQPVMGLLQTAARLPVAIWPRNLSLQTFFERSRDARVIATGTSFPRRPTWLYPDDGCFARAELISQELQAAGLPPPSKIFAFGNLFINTPFSPSGVVKWWYHVVIAYRVGADIFVFDPAVHVASPILILDWLKAMNANQSTQLSICNSAALDPESSCLKSAPGNFKDAMDLEADYLPKEWARILELGRRPERDLGDQPPWLNLH